MALSEDRGRIETRYPPRSEVDISPAEYAKSARDLMEGFLRAVIGSEQIAKISTSFTGKYLKKIL